MAKKSPKDETTMIKTIILTMILVIIGANQLKSQSNSEIWINDDIRLIHLQDSVFMHTTWVEIKEYGRVGSNGMLIIRGGQAIMVDTPMGEEKTQLIAEYLVDSLSVSIVKLIAGHYHADCVGGLDYLKAKGVESVANFMTINKCIEKGMPVPTVSFVDSLNFDFRGLKIQCRYFGGGHTCDNITVYIPEKKILFGGCLIKSLTAKDIGDNNESELSEWDLTVKRIINNYNGSMTVIPGHGDYGNEELLVHTVKLAEQKKNNKP